MAILHISWILFTVLPFSSGFVLPRSYTLSLKHLQSSPNNREDGPTGSPQDPFDVEELKQAWLMGKEAGGDIQKEIFRRFQYPKIDDEGLVIADALVAGIISPGIEVFLSVASGGPPPHWVEPSSGLITSVLVRGATLATCFVAGALAAEVM
jgi:hypothetical protein